MALDKSVLKEELLKLLDEGHAEFAGFPSSASDAAQNWADAYDTYAADAEDVSGDAVASANAAGFKSALVFADGTPTPVASSLEYDAAFVAYWTGATFAVGTPPSSGTGGNGTFGVELSSAVVSVIPAVLGGLMATILAAIDSDQDPDVKAGKFADAFHDATTSAVLVLISGLDTTPPPGGGPLPIVNGPDVIS